ncbi:glycosyltransferase family 9 protein [Azotosporobacter soli]|uniref:glycosyltransferase family 9 protein n=1 Tax=Azotosporobacter soli TaxID=3055040 RepID=UPI0031FEFE66
MKMLKRIFVSKQAGIGDVILLTPILAEMKRQMNCWITLMVFKNAVDAVQGLPFIDEVFVYDKKKDSSWSVIKKMRGHDAAIFFDLQYRPTLLAFLARVPLRVGIAHKRKLWLTHATTWEKHLDHIYEPYASAELLKKTLGIDMKTTALEQLYFAEATEMEKIAVEKMLEEGGIKQGVAYVACSPLTALFLKDWPREKWRELFVRLYEEQGILTVVFGSFGEQNITWNMPGVVNLSGRTNLRQAAYIVKKAKLLVNSCSLPIHMAAAYDTPCVALYGHTDPKRWAPRRNCSVIMAGVSCSPCDGYAGSNCKEPRCMAEISVDEVYQACCECLQKRRQELL